MKNIFITASLMLSSLIISAQTEIMNVYNAAGTQIMYQTPVSNISKITFTASAEATLSTTAIEINLTGTAAVTGGVVTLDNGSPVMARGVVWSTSANPTIDLTTKTADGTGTGSFTSNITGLVVGTTYYVRAYATNAIGTAYGNELSFTATALVIGSAYQGGVIAYFLQSGDPGYDANVLHGLIATTADLSSSIKWSNANTSVSGTSNAIGSGNANTTLIVIATASQDNNAAKLCADHVVGTYSDWYLPSINELEKLYNNRGAIGGFTNNYYWSSTDYNTSTAFYFTFSLAGAYTYTKTLATNVRGVRAF